MNMSSHVILLLGMSKTSFNLQLLLQTHITIIVVMAGRFEMLLLLMMLHVGHLLYSLLLIV